jgi:redox-sensitive bicupin YhaK (pirin superfamily)
MPAATTDNPLVLPRIPRPDPSSATFRPTVQVVTAPTTLEGAGFQVRRPFPGLELQGADSYLLLDHLGAVEYAPGDAVAVRANRRQDSRSSSLEVLLLGGRPIREPAVFYGPFVMNTHEEISRPSPTTAPAAWGPSPPRAFSRRVGAQPDPC